MKNLTVECTVVFHLAVGPEEDLDMVAKVISASVAGRLKDVFGKTDGCPVATRVFDENGDYVTEY